MTTEENGSQTLTIKAESPVAPISGWIVWLGVLLLCAITILVLVLIRHSRLLEFTLDATPTPTS